VRREAQRPAPVVRRMVARPAEPPLAARCLVSGAAIRPAVRAGFRREQAWRLGCPSAAVERKARVLRGLPSGAQSSARERRAASAAQLTVVRPAVLQPAVRDGTAEPQPAVAWAAVARPREAVAARGVAAEVPRRAAPGVAAVLRPAAQVEALDVEAVRLPAAQAVARDAGEALRPAGPQAEVQDVAVLRPAAPGGRAVRPSAPVSAALLSIRCQEGRLAPLPAGRSAHKREDLRTARRSTRWWRAARGEVLS
jgi:hypothetical protein